MIRQLKIRNGLGIALAVTLASAAWVPSSGAKDPASEPTLPWRAAGLTERQAAAHLLSRFAYGPRPGEVDRVVERGLGRWVADQLRGDLPDRRVDRLVARAESLDLSPREMTEAYPPRALVLRRAVEAGVIERPSGDDPSPDVRRKLRAWAEEQGIRPAREALYELMAQKLLRAVYSENQLTEVLTDFWLNHFNVSITDNLARLYVWPYERDAIRPHVTGSFRAMLEATAKHPAMLHYLDNVRSTAEDGRETTLEARMVSSPRGRRMLERRQQREARRAERRAERGAPPRGEGLNENYARELMELHTLGVDGGYDQEDVIAVARAFTGWTTYPPDGRRSDVERRIRRAKRHAGAGFVFEDAFIFRADAHDAEPKTVLGHELPAGRGMEDGLQVLDLLAAHPSTARRLATKFAVRFVSDDPPESLVDRLARTFERTGGDLGQMVVTLVESPEFWTEEALQAKIKSPFEVVISSLRITGAEVRDPRGIYDWTRRMGQPLYAYQAPTGYPDRADAWVNTGALLNRMNFGLQLATGRVPGVELDLASLAGGREPSSLDLVSLDKALDLYLPLLLPERLLSERDARTTTERLRQVIHDPDLARKVADAAPADELEPAFGADEWDVMAGPGARGGARRPPAPASIDDSPVAHVVGVILGSPESQRR